MNLCAGSDPSLNFPKPFTFSPGYKITKQPNPNNHRPFDLSTLANNVAIGGHCHLLLSYLLPCLITPLYSPIRQFTIHHSPSSNRQPHGGSLAITSAKSPTSHPLLPLLFFSHRPHLPCPLDSTPCRIPSPPGFTATLFPSGYPIRSR